MNSQAIATEVEVLDNTQHRVALVSASGNTIFYGSGTENNWATVTYNDTAYASVDEISSADQPCAISEDGKIAMLLSGGPTGYDVGLNHPETSLTVRFWDIENDTQIDLTDELSSSAGKTQIASDYTGNYVAALVIV